MVMLSLNHNTPRCIPAYKIDLDDLLFMDMLAEDEEIDLDELCMGYEAQIGDNL